MAISVDRWEWTQEMSLNYINGICYPVGKIFRKREKLQMTENSSLRNWVVGIPLVKLGI